jgi:hypothetical protein
MQGGHPDNPGAAFCLGRVRGSRTAGRHMNQQDDREGKTPDAPNLAAQVQPLALVREADNMLGRAGRDLEQIIETLRSGAFGPARDLAPTLMLLEKAMGAIFSERNKLERLGAEKGGGDGGELDLDAARAEIERRMARLRSSLGAGGVSGVLE